MIKAKYIFIVIAIIFVAVVFVNLKSNQNDGDNIACTLDAKVCPDGSTVSREGPSCEFADCPNPVADDIKAHIESKADLIKINSPQPGSVINSPLTINGEARGSWFFEASFPIVLTDWDGLIIAEGFATADGDWMTEEFVPFTATITFESPYTMDSADFMKKGTLLLKKDNPSGLWKNADALEIPVRFAP